MTITSLAPAVPAGVVAVICVAEATVMPVAGCPPMVTAVAPVKSVPVIVTGVAPATGPELGEMAVTVGAATGAAAAQLALNVSVFTSEGPCEAS